MLFLHNWKLAQAPEKIVKVLESCIVMYSASELLLYIGNFHHLFAKMGKEVDMLVLVRNVPKSLGHVVMYLY